MKKSAKEICEEVLKKIKPSEEEENLLKKVANDILNRVSRTLEEADLDFKIGLEGSFRKGTWLKGETDVDIFVRIPASANEETLRNVYYPYLKDAVRDLNPVERFAEHPYVEVFEEGVRVNIVPCYDVKPGEWKSATDRTPYHTEYVLKHLPEEARDEVRLLKKFMKGIGVYGAEIKVLGFSGYLCELLIIHYGDFLKTLKAASNWRPVEIIDVAGVSRLSKKELLDRFKGNPLIVIDPVDPMRNVAAAVSLDSFSKFVLAARKFLEKPDESFFFPPEKKPLSYWSLRSFLQKRRSHLFFFVVEELNLVPDVLWGELRKASSALASLLKREGFSVLGSFIWSENGRSVICLEVDKKELPKTFLHVGPPVWLKEHVDRFLKKHKTCRISAGRLVVTKQREKTSIKEIVKEKMLNAGLPSDILYRVKEKKYRLLVDTEARKLLSNKEFAKALREYLEGPHWLKA